MSKLYEPKKDDFLVRLNGYQIILQITTNVKLFRFIWFGTWYDKQMQLYSFLYI